jgi:hypothetical protein
MKTKLDLVELGRQVMIAREAYNMNRPVDGPLKDGWQSDRDIYIGGHLADYVEAKLNERAERESDSDEKLNRLKADGLISSSPDTWVLERTESMKRLSMLETPHWWGMAQVAVGALVQLAYSVTVYVIKNSQATK